MGFRGRLEKLPDATTLELSTMCGHGMVSAHFCQEDVGVGERKPQDARRGGPLHGPLLHLRRL